VPISCSSSKRTQALSPTTSSGTSNERTPTFSRLNATELESRVAALYWNLGRWIGNADERVIRDEYEAMGRSRYREGVHVSELVYALLLTKQHLRRYIRDHGLVDFAGDRVVPDELLPLELHSIQELNYQVGEFFDRALYHLARGYESEAAARKPSDRPSSQGV
jgi:hypothetical protein